MHKQFYLFFEGNVDGYSPDQIRRTMTVAELMDLLSMYNDDTLVMISYDNGRTYGAITENSIIEGEE